MSFVVYFVVVLITASSVLFGLDWLQAPMSPMPVSQYQLRAAKLPEPAQPAVAATQVPPAPVAVVAPPVQQQEPAPIVVPEPVAAAAPPRCDIGACTTAYRSFTSADCTYQPLEGPRRLCTKGDPPAQATTGEATPSQPNSVPEARAQATCNVSACSQAYISFSSADCTYQPLEGPRRLCEK